MAFSSLSFLFGFLPIVLIFYHLLPGFRTKNAVLLLASLFFYAWGAPKALPLLLASALLVWLCGLGTEKGLRFCFPLSLLFVLGSLFLFKYLGFFARILHEEGKIPALLLPAGISFTSFQLLAYSIDLKRSHIRAEKSFPRFLLFTAFFPQLLQGPILRYGGMAPQLELRAVAWDDAVYGVRRFLIGLGKKVLLADQVAQVSAAIYAAPALAGTGGLWLAALCYTMQIYFDFSGYSDMAVGLGKLFGFSLPENFRYPYTALSVSDFWRRWHITLSQWFRDYVYIPLGGNRVKRARLIRNILTVWALTGLWHGAAWNFVLWGLYYGLLLLIEKLVIGKRLERIPAAFRWLITFTLVNLGWVFFNLTDLEMLTSVLRSMFVFRATAWRELLLLDASLCSKLFMLPFAFLFCFPVFRDWKPREDRPLTALAVNVGFLALFAICVIFLVSASFTPFVYFNF